MKRHARERADDLVVAVRALRVGADLAARLGDVLGIVADPLDDARDLECGDDLAQIVGHRCAQRDDVDHCALDFCLEFVDPLNGARRRFESRFTIRAE